MGISRSLDPATKFYPNREFAPAVAISLSGRLGGGSWRGAFGGVQRQIPARVEPTRAPASPGIFAARRRWAIT